MEDINADSVVVGYFQGPRVNKRPLVWTTPQTFRSFRAPPGAIAAAVNDSGMIAGSLTAVSSTPPHAFSWTLNGGVKDLGDLPGGQDSSTADGMNDSGQIVGTGHSEAGQRAVLWDADGSIHDLGDLPGSASGTQYYAHRVNNFGEVIGESTTSVPWVWTAEARMLPIASLIDPNDPLYGAGYFGLHGINDAGVLAAELDVSGEPVLPVLLIPEP